MRLVIKYLVEKRKFLIEVNMYMVTMFVIIWILYALLLGFEKMTYDINIAMFVIILIFDFVFIFIDFDVYRIEYRINKTYERLEEFRKFVNNNDDVDVIYISRDIKELGIRMVTLIYHNIEFVVDPYRKGYSYGLIKYNDLIETNDILN